MVPAVPGVEIEREIGRGASSTVHLATQVQFGRKVAVKIIDLPGRDQVAAKLFATECRTLGRLTGHPDIVTVFDGGLTDDGKPYLVMDYLPGGTLAERLADRGPYPVADTTAIGIRLCGALETAHRHGIVHGDVKPQNVLWSSAGDPALADFGIARLAAGGAATSRLNVLTPLHAAPELFDGRPPTERTDVYGLASTLFELVDGRPATGDDDESPLTVIARIVRQERRRLDRGRVPDELADVIEGAMAHDPDERPASMAELGEQLAEAGRALGLPPTRMVVIDGLPIVDPTAGGSDTERPTIPPPGPPAGSGGPGGSRRRTTTLVAAALLAVLVVATLVVVADRDDTASAPTSTSTVGTRGEAGTGGSTGASAPTTNGSSIGGVQPDVTYVVRDATDSTPHLDAALADTDAIFTPLGAAPTVLPSNTLKLKRTPATLRYQAFNPAQTPGCAGFMSRPVTVTGYWDRLTTYPTALVSTAVIDFAAAGQADEAYVAFSLGQSPSSGDCTGFRRDFGVQDYDQLDVSHQDRTLAGLPDGVRYNSWLKPAGSDFPQFRYGLAGVVQRDRTLVLFGVLTTGEAGPPDVGATSAVIANVLGRL